MKFYHATPFENLASIAKNGILTGCDGIVYLTTQPGYATRFLAVRLITNILVVEVELDPEEVEEQFDHDEKFFGCKTYGYSKDIPVEKITNFLQYKRVKEEENDA